jgi:hypothetical protein
MGGKPNKNHLENEGESSMYPGLKPMLRSGLIAAVFLAALSASAASPITSSMNGKCVDAPAGRVQSGAQLQMANCSNAPSQQFELTAQGQLKVGGLCVDALGGSGKRGDKIGLWDCHGAANQRWRHEAGAIKGIGNRCIDIEGGNNSAGAKLVLWDCHGASNQKWTLAAAQPAPTAQPAPPPQPQAIVEPCFGAVGSKCDGAPNAGVTRNRDGSVTAKVSVGSILHDNRCVSHPGGKWCNGRGTDGKPATETNHNGKCAKEWDKAFWNSMVTDNRQWDKSFNPKASADLQTVPARKSRFRDGSFYDGLERRATKGLEAPRGTYLDQGDEDFCASKRAEKAGQQGGNGYIRCL